VSDFYKIKKFSPKPGVFVVEPDFVCRRSRDIMVRGGKFYAVWDEEAGLWSTDEYRIQEIVDRDLRSAVAELGDTSMLTVVVKYLADDSTGAWKRYRKFVTDLPDNFHQLDEKLCFSDTEVTKKDYISKRLPYPLQEGDHSAWDEIVGTLYLPEEREKIEWAIGAVVSGDSRSIQKFLVFYGDPGTGKGTILDIIKELFGDYAVSFDSGELTGLGNNFPMEQFRTNPLVAIQFDGDLSHIADNTKLNSLVSHEPMVMHIKRQSSFDFTPHCFLFLASNHPVKITDAKSGIIRRLIDVQPSLQRIPIKRYFQLKNQIQFEKGAIAHHCLQVYEEMGKHYYDGYKPVEMMFKTDPFFNFVDHHFLIFSKEDGVTLKNAYDMYKDYCEQSNLKRLPMYQFREELKNYFNNFESVAVIDGTRVRSWYSGFNREKFDLQQKGEKNHGTGSKEKKEEEGRLDGGKEGGGAGAGDIPEWLRVSLSVSLLDEALRSCPAQLANSDDKPTQKWADVTTRLCDIPTNQVHFVRPPLQHIVIDFDKKDEHGNKSLLLNQKAAASWKPTYAEVSKGGQGLHLHYIWDGDISKLASVYEEDVEIKKFGGNSSLRRRVSLCNDLPIAHLSSGLPLKEEKKTVSFDSVRSEKGLRDLIERNLRKEIHPGTKPSIDFIEKILDDAYEQGLHYDVSDMRPDIMDFAIHSSHQAEYCLTRVAKMKFQSKDATPWSDKDETDPEGILRYSDERIVFFDVEVFPNLLLINWKFAGDDRCQRMINPKPGDIEQLMKYKLVGFNCRRYDNHILYAAYLGKSNLEIYDISQGIIAGSKNCTFREAYNVSYTDVYDFCSKKQSLKKWEIELGIHHQELGLPWDQPVPEEKWLQVAEYCDNDVFATEALFNARQADWTARQILADLAEMSVNDTTNNLTTRIIFGGDKNPQSQFEYRFMGSGPDVETYCFDTKAEEMDCDQQYTIFNPQGKPVFPGYTFDHGKSIYRGEEVGEGGYVYAEPGIHRHVALLDIASMHPSSIVAENLFGDEYTKHFRDILQARIFIKHKEYEKAKELFGGKLAPYLEDPAQAKALAGALKIAINSVYGLTSAKFDNAFRDIRNIDNIVAKRGALFMVNLKHEVQKRGFTVAHIKTDSIKIPEATPEIIQFVMDYGKLYGYNFEHEATYDRMCLVNDAVYIARYSEDERNEHPGEWTATGKQFAVPFVFKSLFSKEPIRFEDLTETMAANTALYLDMNENLPDVSGAEKEYDKLRAKVRKLFKEMEANCGVTEQEWRKADEWHSNKSEYSDNHMNRDFSEPILEAEARMKDLKMVIDSGHEYVFIGKVGLFAPVKKGCGGGWLMREKDGKYYAAGGTTGYRWMEAETIHDHLDEMVDMTYFTELSDDAIATINEYGDFYDFVDGSGCSNGGLPWEHKPNCGEFGYDNCIDCPHWKIQLDGDRFEEAFQCEFLVGQTKGE
jgi:hypothetical protein